MTPVATRVACPVDGCTYAADNGASIPAHVAMAHPDLPIVKAAGKRSARNGHTVEAPAATPHAAEAFPPAASASPELREIPLDLVDVGVNVRISIEDLDELTASIAEHGVLQPVKVSPAADGRYLLLWGQRRTLAARQAGLATIPAIVVDAPAEGPQRSVEQLVENLHRADLNPIDRAQAMREVVDSGVSQADLARKLGIAPSTVANDLRILTLDERVLEQVRAGTVTPSHAKAMVSLAPKHQRELAGRIAATKLSSHQVEQELSWRRTDTENAVARETRTEKAIPKVTAALEAAGVAKDVAVHLRHVYNLDMPPLEKAVKAAGWSISQRYVQERPERGKCDCKAIVLEFNRTWKVTPGCLEDKHRDRARNLDHLEDTKRRAELAARAAVLRERIRPLLDDVALPVLVLAYGDNWGLAELVAKAAKPDYEVDVLRNELADRLVGRIDPSRVYNDRGGALEAALETLIGMLGEATS